MNSLVIWGREYKTPQHYNELTREQLLQVCRLLIIWETNLAMQVPIITKQDIELRLLQVLLGVKRGFLFHGKKAKTFYRLSPAAVRALINDPAVMSWIFEPAQLSRNTLSKFSYRGVRYYGPQDSMVNIEVGELIEALLYFGAYTETQRNKQPNDELLNKLIAVLYRPQRLFYALERLHPNHQQDRRRKGNTIDFNRRAKRFNGLDQHIKLAIFLQFEGSFAAFSKRFPKCFSKKSGKSENGQWIKLLMAMSGDIFGNYEQTQKTNAYTFFMKVEQNIQMNEEANMRLKGRHAVSV